MNRLKKIGAVAMCVLGVALLSPASPALALDVWEDTGVILDSVTGQTVCTTRGSISSTGSSVTARGSVGCTRAYEQLEIQVCIQVQQSVVDEGVTWKDYACAAPVVKSGTSASNSVTARCLPGTWDYRAKVAVGGYRGNETPFTSLVVSSPIRVTCLVE